MHSLVHDRLPRSPWAIRHPRLFLLSAFLICLLLASAEAFAHAVTEGDKGYIQEISGVHLLPFMYLGAKHMMTGYDHILFLFGVIFFLYGMKEIGLYVTLFAIGHSVTMLLGVWYGWGINAYIIDAIIGLSVVYVSLFQLGNTAAGVATDVSNGGAIVNAYVLSLFGQPGQFILAGIITLAWRCGTPPCSATSAGNSWRATHGCGWVSCSRQKS